MCLNMDDVMVMVGNVCIKVMLFVFVFWKWFVRVVIFWFCVVVKLFIVVVFNVDLCWFLKLFEFC